MSERISLLKPVLFKKEDNSPLWTIEQKNFFIRVWESPEGENWRKVHLGHD